MFFQNHPEFVDLDNRQNRIHTPLTYETLTNKHEKMAPEELIRGKTILDLGSCLGATGHWALTHGSSYYTGIEIQNYYVEKSNELLSKYWNKENYHIVQDEIINFLSTTNEQYDIVFACGVIYGFLNTYGFLDLTTRVAKECVVVDCSYPTQMTHGRATIIDIVNIQHMIKSEDHRSYLGLGARPSPGALNRLMLNFGFENKENILYPKKLDDSKIHDTYHDIIKRDAGINTPARYLMRFFRTDKKIKSTVENLIDDTRVVDLPITPALIKENKPWSFDKEVADRFQKEAETHIPDYQKVIDMSIDYVNKHWKTKDIKIIDVGSALGHTIGCFLNAGFSDVRGVEKSQQMIEKSKFSDRIIFSENFPKERFHAVVANWTIHFIEDKYLYLKDIYDRLSDNGILILTEKMIQTEITKNEYYDFKRSNGVSDEIIYEKEKKLQGVMFVESLSFYLNLLERLGFKSVEMINSRYNFNTLICIK